MGDDGKIDDWHHRIWITLSERRAWNNQGDNKARQWGRSRSNGLCPKCSKGLDDCRFELFSMLHKNIIRPSPLNSLTVYHIGCVADGWSVDRRLDHWHAMRHWKKVLHETAPQWNRLIAGECVKSIRLSSFTEPTCWSLLHTLWIHYVDGRVRENERQRNTEPFCVIIKISTFSPSERVFCLVIRSIDIGPTHLSDLDLPRRCLSQRPTLNERLFSTF